MGVESKGGGFGPLSCVVRGCGGQTETPCSGKLKLDTEEVISVQKMYNENDNKPTFLYRLCPKSEQEIYHEVHQRKTIGHWASDL